MPAAFGACACRKKKLRPHWAHRRGPPPPEGGVSIAEPEGRLPEVRILNMQGPGTLPPVSDDWLRALGMRGMQDEK